MNSSRNGTNSREAFSLSDLFPDGQDRVARAIRKADGLRMLGGDRGLLLAGELVAMVRLEPQEQLLVSLPMPTPVPPLEALQQTHLLPGNLRLALTDGGAALLADTQLDGEVHLTETLRHIRVGLQQGRNAGPWVPPADVPPVEKQRVRDALTQLGWEEDATVEQEEGWEVRPRVRGTAVPVQLQIEARGLRLFRVVLRQMPGKSQAEAVADQALRFNAQLRHVRLAIADNRLVAESLLHHGLVQSSWVSLASHAVAVAARHVETALRILAGQPAVAQSYAAMFCPSRDGAASEDVAV